MEKGSITYHPSWDLPHGPQSGKIEASLGAKEANEIAVMVDTFQAVENDQSGGGSIDRSRVSFIVAG